MKNALTKILFSGISLVSCILPFLIFESHTNMTKTNNINYVQQWMMHPPSMSNATIMQSAEKEKPPRKHKKSNRTRLYKYLHTLSPSALKLEQLNSIEYYACCGLGHRFTKLVDAWYLSRQHQWALKAFWGFCGNGEEGQETEEGKIVEMYDYMFGSQPLEEIVNVPRENKMIRLNNEIPGMKIWARVSEEESRKRRRNITCPCTEEKIASDIEFYQSMQGRFRFKHMVTNFQQQHLFQNHTVIGIHIRAGNGETGDFVNKKRGISNHQKFVRAVCRQLSAFMNNNTKIKNPLFYIASDTATMIEMFERRLRPHPVIELPQDARKEKNTGVLFGARGIEDSKSNINNDNNNTYQSNAKEEREQCIQGWVQAVTDMILLSSANIVIAARPSSFVQSMPMAISLSKPGNQYCEITSSLRNMRCYSSYEEWCCGKTSSTKEIMGSIQKHEYIRVPTGELNFEQDVVAKHVRIRHTNILNLPMAGSTNRLAELPFTWNHTYSKDPSKLSLSYYAQENGTRQNNYIQTW